MTTQLAQPSRHWEANLSLDFCIGKHSSISPRTIINSRKHQGPLVIQKPFYPEGDPCHIYLLHPPAGLVGGDRLTLSVSLQQDAHVLITTPGAAKFYRSNGSIAAQQQTLQIADNALLEWLPQETIVFDKSNAEVRTSVRLSANAKFIGWEICCLGRQAGNLPFNDGQFVQKIQLQRDNIPLLIERALYQGNTPILSSAWGLANHTTVGTMMITPANQQLLESIRAQVKVDSPQLFSATLMNGVLVCRYLGAQAANAKKVFTQVWEISRPAIQNINACVPRIWNT